MFDLYIRHAHTYTYRSIQEQRIVLPWGSRTSLLSLFLTVFSENALLNESELQSQLLRSMSAKLESFSF